REHRPGRPAGAGGGRAPSDAARRARRDDHVDRGMCRGHRRARPLPGHRRHGHDHEGGRRDARVGTRPRSRCGRARSRGVVASGGPLMSDATLTQEEAATTFGGADEVVEELGGRSPLWRWLGTPLLLAGVLVALYVYVQGQDLDRIEEAALNAPMIRKRVIEHIELTAVSTFFVIVIAIPLGVISTRRSTRKAAPVILAVANVGQS